MWKLMKDDALNYYYFEDENGNRSKDTYEFAQPYSHGFALVQKESGKGYYFRNEAGKLSQKYNEAKSFNQNGYAIVKRTQKSGYQFMDVDGNLSEEFAMIENSYRDGLSRVQKYENGDYQFIDENLKVSDDKWGDASQYSEGFAVVAPKRWYTSGNHKYFRDKKGNLSEPFDIAWGYHDGFSVVRCLGEDEFRFRDRYGNLSEDSYVEVRESSLFEKDVPTGFYKVKKTKDSPEQYRDLLGNLSDEQTQVGMDYLSYIKDKKSIFELDLACFADDKFLKIIMQREQDMLMQASEHCENEEDIKKVAELAEYIGEYVRDRVYEAYLKAETEKVEAQKKKRVENARADLQTQIGKMF